MNVKKFIIVIFFLVTISTMLVIDSDFSWQASQAVEKFVIIGTGKVTGVYYPTGSAICRMVNRYRRTNSIRCSIDPSNGSLDNIQSLKNKTFDLGIIQSDIQYNAYNGIDNFANDGPDKSLRSIFSLHNDDFTVVVRSDSGIKTIEDLKGKKINISSKGSGSREMLQTIMDLYGLTSENFIFSELTSSEESFALCNNKIDAIIASVGHPNAAIQEVSALCDITIIPITGNNIEKLLKDYSYYTKSTIPGGLYAGNPNNIPTFSVKVSIITREDVNDNVIYQVVKSLFDHFDVFRNLHPVLHNLVPKDMIQNNIIPIHKGAERYYKEKGLL
ncbi:TRAP transporter solute receptor, TAXI family [Rickettsiales bacterium Ac37b]|nr:TRAP transporter solute receptor, TAXI family [Rickettsiales bacterium Ac37b]